MIAGLDVFDALAHLVHHPGGVQPYTGGQLDRMGLQHLTFTDPPIDGVHARRPYGDADLTGTHVGFLGVDEAQDLRAAELGEAHFLHAVDRSTNR